MPVNISRLRYWFAVAAIAAVLIVAGFYFYARYRFYTAVREVPQKLGVEIQQSTDTFSLSKSEGGHTLFTIRASKAVQYKQGGRAELHDVNIVVYGHESNRFDQIYGEAFEYDPQSGNVVAKGDVHIDLEANTVGPIGPNQTPPELKNPIHVKTSGLVFNKNTGMAKTDERVDFSIPQASGSAIGAEYDSKSNALTLKSAVRLDTTGPNASTTTARHAVITNSPRMAVLDGVNAQRGQDTMAANKVTVFLREDNTIDHMLAQGDVQTSARGETSVIARAPEGELFMSGKNLLRSAVMRGGVEMSATGSHAMNGHAGRVTMDFGSDAKLDKVRASEGVRLQQTGGDQKQAGVQPRMVRATIMPTTKSPAQPRGSQPEDFELTADAVDFYVLQGRTLDRAETSGAAQMRIIPRQTSAGQGTTVITAGKFTAGFDRNRISALHGAPDAKVVQSTPGQPDKISTSQVLDATFSPNGGVSGFVQHGNFRYREGQPGAKVDRAAWADKANYNNLSQVLVLNGSPRIVEGGMTTSAREIRMNRRTGDAEAEKEVKTTYSELQAQPNGAMLASSDPVHVTAANMMLKRATGVAKYTGDARLWQAANIVQAPVIFFDRDRRSMDAQGTPSQQVSTVLVQQDKNGKLTPVSITSARLTYADVQRKARFAGGVLMRSADGTVTAEHVDVFLKAMEADKGKSQAITERQAENVKGTPVMPGASPSQVDRIIAEGRVVITEPTRRGTGEKLVYTADEGKFVLTGGRPAIFDAERGTITGAALTFFSRNDRVLVEGGDHGRSVTTTRVSK